MDNLSTPPSEVKPVPPEVKPAQPDILIANKTEAITSIDANKLFRETALNQYNKQSQDNMKKIIMQSKLFYVIIGNWPLIFSIISYIFYICGFFLEFSKIDEITGKRIIMPFNKWLQFFGINVLYILGLTILYCSIYQTHILNTVKNKQLNVELTGNFKFNQTGGANEIRARIEGADKYVPLSQIIDILDTKNCMQLINVIVGSTFMASFIYLARAIYSNYTAASIYSERQLKNEIIIEVSKKANDTRTPLQRLRANKN
jgi:hypothetical protein